MAHAELVEQFAPGEGQRGGGIAAALSRMILDSRIVLPLV